jgi:hypothetical protein
MVEVPERCADRLARVEKGRTPVARTSVFLLALPLTILLVAACRTAEPPSPPLQPDGSRDEVRFSGGQVLDANGIRSFSYFVRSYPNSVIIAENPFDPNLADVLNMLWTDDLEKWLENLAVCPEGHRVTHVEPGLYGMRFHGECD